MRKLFVLFVVAVFVAYCVAANYNYTVIEVPAMAPTEIDLLGGMTRSGWEADPTAAKEHLEALAEKSYRLAEDLETGTLSLRKGQVLTEEDLRAIVEADNSPKEILKVMDPEPVTAIAALNYALRAPVPAAQLEAGAALDFEALRALENADVTTVTAYGSGNPIAPQAATMAMTILIFLGLVMALREILFDPLLAIVDARKAELEAGTEAARQNRAEQARIEEERKRLRVEARREYHGKLSAAEHEAMNEADKILKETRTEAHRLREHAHKDLAKTVHAAEAELKNEAPALAGQIVDAVLERDMGGQA